MIGVDSLPPISIEFVDASTNLSALSALSLRMPPQMGLLCQQRVCG
jgi:hypothetical protein